MGTIIFLVLMFNLLFFGPAVVTRQLMLRKDSSPEGVARANRVMKAMADSVTKPLWK